MHRHCRKDRRLQIWVGTKRIQHVGGSGRIAKGQRSSSVRAESVREQRQLIHSCVSKIASLEKRKTNTGQNQRQRCRGQYRDHQLVMKREVREAHVPTLGGVRQ